MATEYSLRGTVSATPSLSGKTNGAASLSADADNEESISGQTAETESLSGKASGKSELAGGMEYVEKGDPGDSAYDIAVKEGFKGTVAEWLASLKGKDGSMPFIIDGYWYIDGKNTYVKAQGDKGDPYTLTNNDKRSIAETVERELEVWRFQPKEDDTLETESKEVVGAINETFNEVYDLSTNVTGNTWLMYDDLHRANDFDYTFDFTSNGKSFVRMKGYLYRRVVDGISYEDYRLSYYQSDGRDLLVYSSDLGGWGDNTYKTVITDDVNINLNSWANKITTNIPERLNTNKKTIVGAINEIKESFGGNIEEEVANSKFGKWLSDFVGSATDFIVALVAKIKDVFENEEFTTLETTEKKIPLAVNNIHRRAKAIEDGTTAAKKAEKLANSRKITLKGDAEGEASFDGSGDIEISVTLNGSAPSGDSNDLTDTKWHIRSGWKAPSEYGNFFLSYNATVGDNTYSDMTRFNIGYTFVNTYAVGDIKLPTAQEDSIVLTKGTTYTPIDSSQEFTLEITGGIDRANTSLIDWLNEYGEIDSPYQKKVDENLETESKEIVGAINEVNTKVLKESLLGNWRFNWDITIPEEFYGKEVNFKFKSGNTYGTKSEYNTIYFWDDGEGISYYGEEDGVEEAYTLYSRWIYECNKILMLEAPDDKEFIAWLMENAQEQSLYTVDKISEVYTNEGTPSYIDFQNNGIYWGQQFGFYDEMGETLATGYCGQCVPIVAGNNVEFELDEDNQVVKINAKGGSSGDDSIAGTWLFNDEIDFSHFDGHWEEDGGNSIYINFESNGEPFEAISITDGTISYYNDTTATYYDSIYEDGWVRPECQTITINEETNDDIFIGWLRENAVQISKKELATLDKLYAMDASLGDTEDLYNDDYGIWWSKQVAFYSEDDEINRVYISQTIPIVAGENIEFETNENNQVVKISAKVNDDSLVGTWVFNEQLTLTSDIDVDVDFTGYDEYGVKREFNRLKIRVIMDDPYTVSDYSVCYYDSDGNVYVVCDTMDAVWYNNRSRTITIAAQPSDKEFIAWFKENATKQVEEPPYVTKIKVEFTGSGTVADLINSMIEAGYKLGQFAIFEFSGANNGTYGLTINHYGGNVYNIGGIDFSTFYSMANNVTNWSTVSVWSFLGMFQPPMPYCDDSNNGQVLKVVNGVPTWTT